jgi:hypothetical protein
MVSIKHHLLSTKITLPGGIGFLVCKSVVGIVCAKKILADFIYIKEL